MHYYPELYRIKMWNDRPNLGQYQAFITFIYSRVCVGGAYTTMHVCKLGDNLWEAVLWVHHVTKRLSSCYQKPS